MKRRIKKFLQTVLFWSAKRILRCYQPEIIAITGSIGKTSTKEAIYQVLSQKFLVWRNQKNYNNEIGLPLTILGLESGGKSKILWLGVLIQAQWRAIFGLKNYPKILVLEMGADHPGDLAYLVNLARPQVSVVTLVAPVHLEFFKTIENIAKEKSEIIKALPAQGLAVLNADDDLVLSMKKLSVAPTLTFGLSENADLRASEIRLSFIDQTLQGLSFKVNYLGSTVPMLLSQVIAEQLVPDILAAVAVGLHYGLNLLEIAQALKTWRQPKGRMNLILGIKNTLIIDDTYNASPQSSVAAIAVLAKVPVPTGKKRIAVFGDLLELGEYTKAGHEEVAQAIVDQQIDELITVGKFAKIISDQASKLGLASAQIHHFADNKSAGHFVQELIQSGEVVLVKGSQGARLEKVVKEIMVQPEKAKELLVRQEKPWQ
ncbi:MAG: UDP-N-acetylmuramoyl-tripeptide--D-alanyl-D-alanine ligase [Candidatus Buchananbacteria bacterium]